MRATVVLALLVAVVPPATAQAPVAVTMCVAGGPVIYLRAPLPVDSLTGLELLTHERMHALQLARFPSCDAGTAYLRANASAHLQAEAEAVCAGLAVLPIARRRGRRREYVENMRYTLPADSAAVEQALDLACGTRVSLSTP